MHVVAISYKMYSNCVLMEIEGLQRSVIYTYLKIHIEMHESRSEFRCLKI